MAPGPWALYHKRRDLMIGHEGIDGGFTLIELLIVIAVVGILAAVTVFALTNVTGQSTRSACRADARSVEVATEAFRTETGGWPANGIQDLVGGAAYLRSAPSSTHYSITVTPATGAVMVAAPPTALAANYDTADPCQNAT